MTDTMIRTTIPTTQIVASNIRAEAARLGYSQRALAKMIGLNQGAVSLRWQGKRQWQLEELDNVAELLGVTVADLVTPSKNAQSLEDSGQLLPRLDSNQQPFGYWFPQIRTGRSLFVLIVILIGSILLATAARANSRRAS